MVKYILEGKNVVQTEDTLAWAKWMEEADRRVARTELKNGLVVSTVFLGIDHSFSSKGEPILFETMVFNNKGKDKNGFIHDWLDYQERYHTWDEAENGHKIAVAKFRHYNTGGSGILQKLKSLFIKGRSEIENKD